MNWPLVIAAGTWLGVLLIVWTFRLHRRHDVLTYTWTLPTPKGFAGLGRAVARSFEAMAYGSSVDTWRARCKASLKASRRRRGWDV